MSDESAAAGSICEKCIVAIPVLVLVLVGLAYLAGFGPAAVILGLPAALAGMVPAKTRGVSGIVLVVFLFWNLAVNFEAALPLLVPAALLLAGLWARRISAACAWTLVLYFFAVCLILPGCPRADGPSGLSMQCSNNLKQIALALQNYSERYGCLPPACVCDRDGRPMHSWRVLILPYLYDSNALAAQYRFDEPWDGPNNRKLADQMPGVYRCPCSKPESMATSYVAAVGPGTLWAGRDSGLRGKSPGGDLSGRLLVVESAGSDIPWMEPRDLEYGTFPLKVNPPGGLGISAEPAEHSRWPRRKHYGANAVMGDLTARWLPDGSSSAELRAILTGDTN